MAEETINGVEFAAEKMSAKKATNMLLRLTKIAGPGLQGLISAYAGGSDPVSQQRAGIEAITRILDNADPDAATDLIVDLAQTAQVRDGAGYMAVIYDRHCADLGTAFQVVGLVLRANYADFFGGAGALLSSGGARTKG